MRVTSRRLPPNQALQRPIKLPPGGRDEILEKTLFRAGSRLEGTIRRTAHKPVAAGQGRRPHAGENPGAGSAAFPTSRLMTFKLRWRFSGCFPPRGR